MSTLTSRFTRLFGAALTAKIIARKSQKQAPLLAACDAAIYSCFDGSNYMQLAHRFNLPAWTIRAAIERHRAAAAEPLAASEAALISVALMTGHAPRAARLSMSSLVQ
jgi:hypothetical protein